MPRWGSMSMNFQSFNQPNPAPGHKPGAFSCLGDRELWVGLAWIAYSIQPNRRK